MEKAEFDAGEFVGRIRLTVKKPRFFSLRLKVASCLLWLAAKVGGMHFCERVGVEFDGKSEAATK